MSYMSDMRFIIIGIVLIFVGFIVINGFGHDHQMALLESSEFETCYKYFDDSPPVEIDCTSTISDQVLFFGIVVGFIATGIVALVKGLKGDWDSRVKPEDMVGPGRNHSDSSNNGND